MPPGFGLKHLLQLAREELSEAGQLFIKAGLGRSRGAIGRSETPSSGRR